MNKGQGTASGPFDGFHRQSNFVGVVTFALWVVLRVCLYGSGIASASAYPDGFVWQRSGDWKTSGGTPTLASKIDSQGNAAWTYSCVSGGDFINSSGTNKWWKLTRTDLPPGQWSGYGVFLYGGTSLPYVARTAVQMYTNDLAISPLVVWKNPAGNGAMIQLSGSVSWSGGGGTNTSSVDYMLALHRLTDNSWQTLDSVVFAPSGSTTPGGSRDYSGAQGIATLMLDTGDEIVWGFKRAANFTSTGAWMNLLDSLKFTLVGMSPSVSVGDITVAAPASGVSTAAFTVVLSNTVASQVTVNYATADGSAKAGIDYAPASGTLTFAPGQLSQAVNVPIYGNGAQPDKIFTLNLSNANGVLLSRSTGTCTIGSGIVQTASGLFAVAQGIAGIALSWTPPAVPPSGYLLQRSANGDAFQTLASIPSTIVSYLDTTVQPGIAYSYRLVSFNAVVSATTPSVTATLVAGSNTFPPGAFGNIADYGMMWWRSGVRGEHVWQARTSRYAMTFYGDTLNLTTLFPIPSYIPEAQALLQPNSQSIPDSAPVCSSSFTLTAAGTTSAIAANDTSTSSQQLLENGKFYQRRWQKIKTTSGIVLDSTNSGLEVCAWPDRVSIVCRVIPTTPVASGSLDMTLSLQSIYNILSGWGTNQQWDEAAIGCWGENLCYEPDSTQASAIGTDSRPLLLLNGSSAQKGWTGNYGGCDFLRYYDSTNTRRWHQRIRTCYQRYGPALTEVTYAGITDNSSIEFQYSASLYRTNDCVRGRHHLRYDVKSTAPFTRMVFFQLAADSYNYNGGTAHAYGYGDQLVPASQWTSSGVTSPVALTGTLPWFSTLNCPVDSSVPSLCGATRGFIIRSWKARINGQDNVPPYFVAAANSARFDIVPPPGVSTLQVGDYVEAEIERVYFGQSAAAYYGGDANMTTALQNYGNTHQMVIREAIGNNLAVSVATGTLEKSYPIRIRATNNTARFSIARGIGYVPITLTGLSDYRKPLLEERVGSTWVAVNQATVGKDFWQTDFDPASGLWQVTFNVKLDAAYQAWKNRFFGAITDPAITGDSVDADGTGLTNLQKYAAGIDPLNPNDRFVAEVSRNGSGMALQLNGRAGRVYVLERSTRLLSSSWQEIVRTNTLPNDQTVQLNDPTPPPQSGFYRLKALAP